MSICAAFDPAAPYATQVLALADCHALALAQGGYQALADGGGALAGLLTVFVALLGYRLMLGQGPSLGEGAGLLARVALVLALATQWPAYQVLVFDVVTGAPRALAGALAGAAGLGPVDGAAQAGQADALAAQAAAIIATPDPVPLRPGLRMQPAPTLPDAIKAPVHWASGVLMLTVLGGWLSTRLVAGVLLGLGPVLVAGLLFAGTRGLALGWMRVLIGATLGQVVVALVAAMALNLAQEQMAGLTDALRAGNVPVAMADALLTTAAVFAAIMLAGLVAVAGVAAGLSWPKAWRSLRAHHPVVTAPPALIQQSARTHVSSSQRVERIAAAARAMDRRDAAQSLAQRVTLTHDRPAAQARDAAPTGAQIIRLGQSGRRSLPRISRAITLRNGDANP